MKHPVASVGVVFFVVLTVTAWVTLAFVLTPFFLVALLPLGPMTQAAMHVYRRMTRFGQWIWMGNVVAMLELLYGIQIKITGDPATVAMHRHGSLQGERALWISNHRTCIDWLLLWILAFRTRTLSDIRIVMKAPLRNLPLFGWAMQHLLFIFLRRHWSEDQVMLEQLLPVLADKENGASYLLFPEGTDLSPSNVEKSGVFATKNNLPKRSYSLYPRTTGWAFMVPRLRPSLDAIYDVTMSYVDHTPNERPSEASLLTARMPRMIHFHVVRTPIAEIPQTEEELATWMQDRFAKKEETLKAFYEENGKLPANATPLFEHGPMANFTVVSVIMAFMVVTATYYAWLWPRTSFVLSSALILAYTVATKWTPGIDNILLKML